jgi:hypothetical protein
MKKCKWCLNCYPTLAKSHIIPTAFFNHDGNNDRKMITVDDFAKKSRTGPYDENILCLDCENAFKGIDSTAAQILLQKFDQLLIPFNNKTDEIAFQIDGSHRHAIKQFLIYTLWRASVSTLSQLKGVSLGSFEDKIKESLINNKAFDVHEYSFSAFKVKNSSGNFLPRKLNKQNFSNRNYYELDFANFIFQIKVDSQTTPASLSLLARQEHCIFNKLEETPKKRRRAMIEIIKLQR